MKRAWTCSASIPAVLLVTLLAGGCGNSPLLGSYKGTASVVLSPTGGGASSTVVATDVLINIDDVGGDGMTPRTDLQLSVSNGIEPLIQCTLLAAGDGDSASIPDKGRTCDLTQGTTTSELQDATGTAERRGDVLTIDLSGTYRGNGEGGFTARFNANFVPGTAP